MTYCFEPKIVFRGNDLAVKIGDDFATDDDLRKAAALHQLDGVRGSMRGDDDGPSPRALMTRIGRRLCDDIEWGLNPPKAPKLTTLLVGMGSERAVALLKSSLGFPIDPVRQAPRGPDLDDQVGYFTRRKYREEFSAMLREHGVFAPANADPEGGLPLAWSARFAYSNAARNWLSWGTEMNDDVHARCMAAALAVIKAAQGGE